MKKQLTLLLILLPILLVTAGLVQAYTPPTSSATGDNTDAPIDDSMNDQVKAGGLAVNAFASQNDAWIVGKSTFNGMIRGGMPSAVNSTVSFGSPTINVGVVANGTLTADGYYQSDTLKTGGGKKPVCADANGTFYLCAAPTPPVNTTPVYFYFSGYSNTVQLTSSEPIADNISVAVHLVDTNNSGNGGFTPLSDEPVSFLDKVRNYFTANAFSQTSCGIPLNGSNVYLTIAAYQTVSNTYNISDNCTSGSVMGTISSYSPQTSSDGRTVVADSTPFTNY